MAAEKLTIAFPTVRRLHKFAVLLAGILQTVKSINFSRVLQLLIQKIVDAATKGKTVESIDIEFHLSDREAKSLTRLLDLAETIESHEAVPLGMVIEQAQAALGKQGVV